MVVDFVQADHVDIHARQRFGAVSPPPFQIALEPSAVEQPRQRVAVIIHPARLARAVGVAAPACAAEHHRHLRAPRFAPLPRDDRQRHPAVFAVNLLPIPQIDLLLPAEEHRPQRRERRAAQIAVSVLGMNQLLGDEQIVKRRKQHRLIRFDLRQLDSALNQPQFPGIQVQRADRQRVSHQNIHDVAGGLRRSLVQAEMLRSICFVGHRQVLFAPIRSDFREKWLFPFIIL